MDNLTSLRDRIAALLQVLRPVTPLEAADAVIKELGLRREQCPCSQRGPNCAHRYITDWIVTE